MDANTMEVSAVSSKELKIQLPHTEVVLLSDTYLKGPKSTDHRDICTSGFTVALFTIAKKSKTT